MPKAISVSGRRIQEPKAEDLDPIDSMGLVESAFLSGIPATTRQSIERAATDVARPTASTDDRVNLAKNKDYSTEKLLLSMYEVHDSLVSSFEGLKHTSPLAKSLNGTINKVNECIIELGGEIETFSPLDHVSGLTVPSSVKNAYQVIETTKECYGGGEIEEADVSLDTISIVFVGNDQELNVLYRANGTVYAKSSWNGNEAIDYIYTPGEGKMSVKVLEGGRWVDKSNDYKIRWELHELDLNTATNDDLLIFKKIKESPEAAVNNEADGNGNAESVELEEEDLDFTIEER